MLINLIIEHASQEAEAGQFEEVANILNTKSIAVRNTKSWTLGEIEQSLGADAARIIAGAIKGAAALDPLMEFAFVAVSTTGIQLHTDERQAMIAVIGQTANLSAEQISAMQALGLTYQSPAQQAGLGVVGGEQCQEVWALHKRLEKLRSLQERFDVIKNQVGTVEQSLAVGALREMANELEAG